VAVRIARGSRTRWREARDLYFRIESKAEASLLADVVGQLGVELLGIRDEDGLTAASFVSDVVPTLDGLVFWVDVPDASRAVIDRFVATVVGALEAAGVDGRVSSPEAKVPGPSRRCWRRSLQ
jgi:hypothetical protein